MLRLTREQIAHQLRKGKLMKDTKEIIKFVKLCLKDEGYSKELINYLFSTYDLEQFINDTNLNKLDIASHFLGHARAINTACENY